MKNSLIVILLAVLLSGCGGAGNGLEHFPSVPGPSIGVVPAAENEGWVRPDGQDSLAFAFAKVLFKKPILFDRTNKDNSTPLIIDQSDFVRLGGPLRELQYSHHVFFSGGNVLFSATEVAKRNAPFCALGMNVVPENEDEWDRTNLLQFRTSAESVLTQVLLRDGSELYFSDKISGGIRSDSFLNVSLEYEDKEVSDVPGMLFYCAFYHPELLMADKVGFGKVRPLTFQDVSDALGALGEVKVRKTP
jgi:hypothetical protein